MMPATVPSIFVQSIVVPLKKNPGTRAGVLS